MHRDRPQTPAEELANAITHGVGAVLGLAALAVMLRGAPGGQLPAVQLGAALVYGVSLVVLFGGSAAYHAVREPRLKRVLRTVDHCAIHLLIAGTYTPFALVTLGDAAGWALFTGVWSLAGVGLALETLVEERWERTSLGLYLVAGWLGVFALFPLVRALPGVALALVALGGVLYTGGVWFYRRNGPWDHVIWHGFVLGGAGAHGAAVLGFVC